MSMREADMTERATMLLVLIRPPAYRPSTARVAPNPHAVGIVLDFEPFTGFDQFSNRDVSRSSLHPTSP